MARRRMFHAELIDSDRFMDMPVQAQMLYVYLNIHADDEGFITAAKRMARQYGGMEYLDILEQSGFIIRFDSGVVLITDWLINNTIRKDRSMETTHKSERDKVMVLDGRYVLRDDHVTTVCQPNDNQVTTTCQPTDDHLATQNRVDKNRIENNRKEESIPEHSTGDKIAAVSVVNLSALAQKGVGERDKKSLKYLSEGGLIQLQEEENPPPPSIIEISQFMEEEKLSHMDPMEFYRHYSIRCWKDPQGKPIQNWKAVARAWNEHRRAKREMQNTE